MLLSRMEREGARLFLKMVINKVWVLNAETVANLTIVSGEHLLLLAIFIIVFKLCGG